MPDDEKIKQTRNVIRWIYKKMSNEFDIRCRDRTSFFFVLVDKCKDIDVIRYDGCRYILTNKEQVNGIVKHPRHSGKYSF